MHDLNNLLGATVTLAQSSINVEELTALLIRTEQPLLAWLEEWRKCFTQKIHVYIYVCTYTYMCLIHTHMCIYTQVSYICVCVFLCVHLHIRVPYTYTYVSMCVHLYIHTPYTYTCTHLMHRFTHRTHIHRHMYNHIVCDCFGLVEFLTSFVL